MEGNVEIKRAGEALPPANAARGYRDELPPVAAVSPRQNDNKKKNLIQNKKKSAGPDPAVKAWMCRRVNGVKMLNASSWLGRNK